jgi:hypothetical protein
MDETLAELISEPLEVARVAARRRRARLDLDPDDAVTRELDEQVDLLSAAFGAQVMQAWSALADGQLGS